ncbi:MAG TPA: protein kinase [Polyangiaceae bacterium]|nr:protein kinase [Polyangiaceae bacterium]
MSETALAEGSLIAGRYRLDAHLGEGGMGTVWSATHTVTRRAVAMKFLKESMRNRKDLRERFLREAAAASALKHPNVVEIIDVFDFAEGCPVMVMELLQGETLGAKLLRDERLSLQETASLLLPVLSAVGTAHALGIVHRDLKPDNLFLLEGEGVKVLDFGIAKLSAERYLQDGPSALLTESGSMLGTPCYMAPEQASGDHPLDHRADIWSVGVILYECLAGMRPIEGENLPQVVARLMSAGIMPLERIAPELPGEVSALVTQMLTREVSRRPASLLEVSKVLARFTHVRAPDFAAPSGMSGSATAKTMESARTSNRPKAKIVQNRDADPRGPTMLSSPPVNSSLLHPALAEAPKPRRSLFGVAMVGVLLIAIALLAMERKPPAQSSVSTAELPTLPGPPEKPAITPAATSLPASPLPSAAPTANPVPAASAAAAVAPPARANIKHSVPAPKPTQPAAVPSSKSPNPFEIR